MQEPANDNIIVRPVGRRPDPQFEAMIAQLRPGNVDPFDGEVDLGSVVFDQSHGGTFGPSSVGYQSDGYKNDNTVGLNDS
jgi:hypothetical protein